MNFYFDKCLWPKSNKEQRMREIWVVYSCPICIQAGMLTKQ